MFFFFSKILTLFLFPLPVALLAGMVSVFFITGKRNRIIVLVPLVFLWFFSSFPVSQLLIRSLEQDYPPVAFETPAKADAIVILSGMINNLAFYDNRVELNGLVERLTDGVSLYKRKKAAVLIVTGGSGHLNYQKNPESVLAKKFLMEMGVPGDVILVETESRNTAENAIFTNKILQRNNWHKIILITSAFHMRRSLPVFQKQGLEVIPFPTDYNSLKSDIGWNAFIPAAGFLELSTTAIKEWAGILAYKLKGYI